MPNDFGLRIHGASQIVLICSNGEKVLSGEAQKSVVTLESSKGLTVIVDLWGQIRDFGEDDEMWKKYEGAVYQGYLDATGMCIMPGLVDAHTHPVWVGDRVHEFAMKLAGATYMDVHAAGGGIHYTVDHVRKASLEELTQPLVGRLRRMMQGGTTLVEAKSGYGLDAPSEIKMLRAIEKARSIVPIDISSTYCGAHAIPKGSTEEKATDDVLNVQLPAIQRLREAKELKVDNIDVFCEQGVFGIDNTRSILVAGKNLGMEVNFHGDELHYTGSAELGASLGARAISHLEEVSEAGMDAMAEAGSVAVLLPTTAYMLRLKQPPARQMIERGVPVALGSDFNPNAYCMSMPMVMHLACVNMRMTMPEALVAATINAAAALNKSDTHGSIERGKACDFVLIQAPSWEHLIYRFGDSSLIRYVIKGNDILYTNPVLYTERTQDVDL
ncbi:probable imidazolonepropionase [Sycon ciliatum]|uniref:probable imidazolonepropionase n=1 Tax=Sycon ciliatum TaxID=27933 RepID=UPI0020A89C1F|eukprot:scpid45630/ scgid10590/ Probable imidazolonepropionase; Amidohydrolase domain-containing protein 1